MFKVSTKARRKIHYLASFLRSVFSRNVRAKSYYKWLKDDAEKIRYQYDGILNEDSIVFDVGGFEGEFAERIYEKYKCTVYVFEPVPDHWSICVDKFKNNSKIKVYKFGLSDKNQQMRFSVASNASSSNHSENQQTIEVELKSMIEFMRNANIKKIDLLKLNIEGGEYDLLPSLISADEIKKISFLQIQFHDFTEDMRRNKSVITNDLQKTHQRTYNYEFVWEGWKRLEN